MAFRWGRDVSTDIGLLLIRCVLGSVFIFHGAQKLFGVWDGAGLGGFATWLETLAVPYPAYAAVLAGGAEFLGGIALLTGIWMRAATLPLMVTMAVAIVFVHKHTMSMQENGFEYPLTLAVVLCGLACTGPGRFWLNLDAIPKRRIRAATERVELGAYSIPEQEEPLNRTI
jgi:putative oxidoreductase